MIHSVCKINCLFIFSFLLFGCGGDVSFGGTEGKVGKVGFSAPKVSLSQKSDLKPGLFIVAPYIQSGNCSKFNVERKVILWQTADEPHEFKVEYGVPGENRKIALASYSVIPVNNKNTRLYRSELSPLAFDHTYQYTLICDGLAAATGRFQTRTKKPHVHFTVLGDSGFGSEAQSKISKLMCQQNPDFVLHTGNFAHSRGLVEEMLSKAFPYYNDPLQMHHISGSSIMRQVPFYLAFGHYDIHYSSHLNRYPSGPAAFYYFDLPLNGPTLKNTLRLEGAEEKIASYKKKVGERFPKMLNYSFDWGNAHFLVLEGAEHTRPLDPERLTWIKNDLATSLAEWKFVAIHQPLFASHDLPKCQEYRLLAPTLEKLGVDMVFSGQLKHYQRSKPIQFKPETPEKKSPLKIVNGKIKIQNLSNEAPLIKPQGIIYIVSGTGGGYLSDRNMPLNKKKQLEKFTAKFIPDKHSFTDIIIHGKHLTLKQISDDGKVLDQIEILK